ncbi:CidA/LrgA family protein [Clostridium sp. YIM B02505]|uniref:Antiholin-like protein LrgA n=2 Tax=Clostridium TaxID=1485 RepID=A0A6V8SIZ0_9CLOT|nr:MULTISPECIES: CidA/LrgA family protein [Clostridium]MBK1809047.1 CidA/LrgA family protein [Clostridium yunnanense]GFP75118.1 Antiholin-like protein LrgA [Clostridium fungisolvens]
MKLFRELLIILVIFFIGEFISKTFNLPIPGNIIGMLLLLVLLLTKVIKLSYIETISNFFLDHLSFFFIPAGVGLLTSMDVLKSSWGRILIVCILSTIIMIAVTGFVIQLVTKIMKTN